jgi:hypothetical protein
MLRCMLPRRIHLLSRMLLSEQAGGASVPAALSARAVTWRSASTGATAPVLLFARFTVMPADYPCICWHRVLLTAISHT